MSGLLGMFGVATLWEAVFADVGVALYFEEIRETEERRRWGSN
ncbi:MAG: hypothetical protein ACFB2X_03665 [Rivularia sp. (in: cyanobacteria)]